METINTVYMFNEVNSWLMYVRAQIGGVNMEMLSQEQSKGQKSLGPYYYTL